MGSVMEDVTPEQSNAVKRSPADELVEKKADIVLTERQIDKVAGGAPNLFEACATGKHIGKVTIVP